MNQTLTPTAAPGPVASLEGETRAVANRPNAGVPKARARVAAAKAASLAPNTIRSYDSAWRAWAAHAKAAGVEALPAPPDAIAEYLAGMADEGKRMTTLRAAAAAIRYAHKATGLPSPIEGEVKRVLAGLARQAGAAGTGAPRQVTGIRWEQADAIAAQAGNGGKSLAGLRDAAMVAVASDAALRVSEVAALDVDDVAREGDGSGRVTIRVSKTDAEGSGAVLYLGARTMARVEAWLEAAGLEGGRLFRSLRKGGSVQGSITPRAVRTIFARRAEAAGVEGRVSGHSLRVGAAQSLAGAGASLVEMQTVGRWKAPTMPARYARAQLAGRGAVARLRYGGDGGGE